MGLINEEDANLINQLEQLTILKDKGTLTQEEFNLKTKEIKDKLLSTKKESASINTANTENKSKRRNLIITLIGFTVIIITLIISNPSEEEHRKAIKNKLNNSFQSNVTKNNGTESSGEKLGKGIVNIFGNFFMGGLVDSYVTRENYLLFSLTKVNFQDTVRTVGLGIFGNVFLSSKIDEVLNKNKNVNKNNLMEEEYKKSENNSSNNFKNDISNNENKTFQRKEVPEVMKDDNLGNNLTNIEIKEKLFNSYLSDITTEASDFKGKLNKQTTTVEMYLNKTYPNRKIKITTENLNQNSVSISIFVDVNLSDDYPLYETFTYSKESGDFHYMGIQMGE